MSIIKAGTTLEKGFVVTSDDSGSLQIKTGVNELTALDISGDQVVTIPGVNKLKIPGGTAGQVLTTDGNSNLSWSTGNDGDSTAEVSIRTYKYIATANQGVFTGLDSNNLALVYTPTNLMVFVNGEYTTNYVATNGESVVFSIGKPAGTIVEIMTFDPFKKADVVLASTGGQFNGSLSVVGSVSVTGKFIGDASALTNFTSAQIRTALGYTPYNVTNPAGYVTLAQVSETGSAAKLTTSRTISSTGDVVWTTPGFDGTQSVSGVARLSNTGVSAGTYKSVTVDVKGRVTGGSNPTTLADYGITDAQTLSPSLNNIANLPSGSTGLLKKTGANSWTLDTSPYITNVVTSLGYVPYNSSNPSGYLTAATAGALFPSKGDLSGTIPSGVIVLWSGTSLPSGWKLCDGSSGTPDLRDRFVMGAGPVNRIGSTGGSADTVLPEHTHRLSGTATSPAGEHQHDSGLGEFWPDQAPFGVSARTNSLGIGRVDFDNVGYLTSPEGGHVHEVTGTIDKAGVSATGKNIPPFYALAYIMKI